MVFWVMPITVSKYFPVDCHDSSLAYIKAAFINHTLNDRSDNMPDFFSWKHPKSFFFLFLCRVCATPSKYTPLFCPLTPRLFLQTQPKKAGKKLLTRKNYGFFCVEVRTINSGQKGNCFLKSKTVTNK